MRAVSMAHRPRRVVAKSSTAGRLEQSGSAPGRATPALTFSHRFSSSAGRARRLDKLITTAMLAHHVCLSTLCYNHRHPHRLKVAMLAHHLCISTSCSNTHTQTWKAARGKRAPGQTPSRRKGPQSWDSWSAAGRTTRRRIPPWAAARHAKAASQLRAPSRCLCQCRPSATCAWMHRCRPSATCAW